MKSVRIPRKILWRVRYKAYRKKFWPWKSFWRAVLLLELLEVTKSIMCRIKATMLDEELSLLGDLIIVGEVSVELIDAGDESK